MILDHVGLSVSDYENSKTFAMASPSSGSASAKPRRSQCTSRSNNTVIASRPDNHESNPDSSS